MLKRSFPYPLAIAWLLIPSWVFSQGLQQPDSLTGRTAIAVTTPGSSPPGPLVTSHHPIGPQAEPDDFPRPDPDTLRLSVLQQRIALCLARYYAKPVQADALRPWSIMHGVLAFGRDAQIVSHGLKVNAVEYMCHNGLGHDRRMMYLQNGALRTQKGQGFQGHDGQLLAILAQSDVPIDQPIVVEGRTFSVRDLVRLEQRNCRAGTELTFSLMGLSHYLDAQAVWRSKDGQTWNLERLVHEEISQPINGAACGGAHRLMGLSYAVLQLYERGEPITGEWIRAANYIREYHDYALSLQNEDGSFSTQWFEARGDRGDVAKKIYTTGHVMEWLACSLPDERLTDPRVVRGAEFLTELLLAEWSPHRELQGRDVGPKCHAVRALRVYEQRVFGAASDYHQLEHLNRARLATLDQVFQAQRRNGDRATVPGAAQSKQTPSRSRGILRRRF